VRLDPATLPAGAVVAVDLDGHEYVVWRGRSGRLGGAPRTCPHLDHDLAEGYVIDDELVCAGHGWAFDGLGHVYKRNELGRVDPKGRVCTLTFRESADGVDIEHDGLH
jgi:phenylpropionate dioxygenase-like ring-hydroxylating dioxygenase large terminal subunit